MEPWTSFTEFGKSGTIYQFKRPPQDLPDQPAIFLLTTVMGSVARGGSWEFLSPRIGRVHSLSRDWDSVITPARARKEESDDVLVCFVSDGSLDEAFDDLCKGGAQPLGKDDTSA
ncbi:hypothetical protein CFR73_04010 [Novacetimonas maltaceti]|uniref:Uncharacterized protein n=1 Tax=Novacetimonas maltaceti TaxID=1203393 RepID=A0A2S3W4C3_9PROT|nr:hypothetical protein [Novacetimonas maltaceti]POF63711.1 hypothetical protein KMAL_06790 [Novacetimonas maltaceti]PYD61238.1 hypothetical protein CFR73_04010 [Novacetimonas maltaceti]